MKTLLLAIIGVAVLILACYLSAVRQARKESKGKWQPYEEKGVRRWMRRVN